MHAWIFGKAQEMDLNAYHASKIGNMHNMKFCTRRRREVYIEELDYYSSTIFFYFLYIRVTYDIIVKLIMILHNIIE